MASGTKLNILLNDLNKCLHTVYKWLSSNKLTFFPKLNTLSLNLGKRKIKIDIHY